jgi:hypothetical protein
MGLWVPLLVSLRANASMPILSQNMEATILHDEIRCGSIKSCQLGRLVFERGPILRLRHPIPDDETAAPEQSMPVLDLKSTVNVVVMTQ